MGSSVSKTRSLKKSAEAVNETLTKTSRSSNHLNSQYLKPDSVGSRTQIEKNNKVFTERPPAELENMPESDGDKPLLEKAMRMGVVNIEDSPNHIKLDPNHESLKVLNNRKQIESQYEGLFIPRNNDEPDTPERFLTDDQKREVVEKFKPENLKNVKKRKNVYGLLDSRRLSDLIIDYKLDGEAALKKSAEELDVKKENVSILKELIDSGLISLPSNKVILEEIKDEKTNTKKQQLKIVKDDWVQTFRDEINKELATATVDELKASKSGSDDVLDQIKMLEKLVSKSQISTKKLETLTNEGPTEEQVLNRPKKILVKEVIREI